MKLIIFFATILVILSNIIIAQQADTLYYKYAPVDGRHLGIWPQWSGWTLEKQKYFHDELGFSKILVYPLNYLGELSSDFYDNALEAGFGNDSIWIKIWDDNYLWATSNLSCLNYFLDEPVEHNCAGEPSNGSVSHIYPPEELSQIRDSIKSVSDTANFIIGGYKRCSHLIIAGDIADYVMYTSYTKWNDLNLPVCFPNFGWGDSIESAWIPGDENQSESWQDMQDIFEEKFARTWVKADEEEFVDLLNSANTLGLNEIWLYAHQNEDSTNLTRFCEAALETGWLKKIYFGYLSPPDSLRAVENDEFNIDLTWIHNSEYETGFIVERRNEIGDEYIILDSLQANTNQYIDSNVISGSTYFYRVKAYNVGLESDYSNIVEVTSSVIPINKPSDLTAELINESYVQLNWNDNSQNEAGFIVEKKIEDGDFFVLDSLAANQTTYIDSNTVTDVVLTYRIYAYNEFTYSDYSDTTFVEITTTSLPDEIHSSFNYKLYQNYPNPFNNSTVIEFELAGDSKVRIDIFSSTGEHVKTVVDKFMNKGYHYKTIDLSHYTSGVYFYKISTGTFIAVKKLIYLK